MTDDTTPDLLGDYRPKGVPAADWNAVRDIVADTLAASDTASFAKRARYVISRLALHAAAQGRRPTPTMLLSDDFFLHWAGTVEADAAASSLATHRSTLRRLADLAQATTTPAPTTLPARKPNLERYTPDEVEGMLEHASMLKHETTRTRAALLVLAGVGAGLDGRDLRDTPAEAVTRHHGLPVVHATSSRQSRTVVIDPVYADAFLEAAATQARLSPGFSLLGGQSRKSVTHNAVALFETYGGPRVSSTHLRTTWFANRLAEPVALPVLLDQAGLKGVNDQLVALACEVHAEMQNELGDTAILRLAAGLPS